MASIAIVPAAGKAERFGGPKLLVRIKGQPLLDWTLWSLLDGGVDRVVVVTAPGADLSNAQFVSDPRVRLAVNEDPSRGMFSSIQAGLALVSGDPILVLPAAMRRAILLAPSDATLKDVLAASLARRVELPVGDPGILRDVDTVSDLGGSEC